MCRRLNLFPSRAALAPERQVEKGMETVSRRFSELTLDQPRTRTCAGATPLTAWQYRAVGLPARFGFP